MVAAKILPGEYYVTTQNEMIVTVLGSCVSACIRDPIFGIGGMNHFMLPSQNNESGWEKFGIGVVFHIAKLNGWTSKYLLKKMAEDLLPADLLKRPNHGFSIPLDSWLREIRTFSTSRKKRRIVEKEQWQTPFM